MDISVFQFLRDDFEDILPFVRLLHHPVIGNHLFVQWLLIKVDERYQVFKAVSEIFQIAYNFLQSLVVVSVLLDIVFDCGFFWFFRGVG